MHINNNTPLKPFNTFGISVNAAYFTEVFSEEELKEALLYASHHCLKVLVLGGGSNVLLTKDFNGLVIKNSIGSIEISHEDDTSVYIKAGSGVVWNDFVHYCIDHHYAGVENLVLIPGCVGASPMQNIGAYGVEVKDVFYSLDAIHREELTKYSFDNASCEFGYRESIFKNRYKDQFVITSVTYRLNKIPQYNIEYGAIRQQLEADGITEMSISAIANAVTKIRTAKLPNPIEIGNAGSFFKNPSVSKSEYDELRNTFPSIVAYANNDGSMKLAAGWMIEQCGLKGHRTGDAGVHYRQALVLVNYGNASGDDILQLCKLVQASVFDKFGVALSPEVNIF